MKRRNSIPCKGEENLKPGSEGRPRKGEKDKYTSKCNLFQAFGFTDSQPALIGLMIVMQYITAPYSALVGFLMSVLRCAMRQQKQHAILFERQIYVVLILIPFCLILTMLHLSFSAGALSSRLMPLLLTLARQKISSKLTVKDSLCKANVQCEKQIFCCKLKSPGLLLWNWTMTIWASQSTTGSSR